MNERTAEEENRKRGENNGSIYADWMDGERASGWPGESYGAEREGREFAFHIPPAAFLLNSSLLRPQSIQLSAIHRSIVPFKVGSCGRGPRAWRINNPASWPGKTIVFRFTVRSGQPETDDHLSSKIRDEKIVYVPLKKRTSHARIVNFERSVGAGRVSLSLSSSQSSRRGRRWNGRLQRGGRGGCRRRRAAAVANAADGNGTWLAAAA